LHGSDASSVIFASTPASRKHEFPGALPPSLPNLNHGTSSSPVPAPTPPHLPVPSPAPAQQPPHHPPSSHSLSSSVHRRHWHATDSRHHQAYARLVYIYNYIYNTIHTPSQLIERICIS
ncbi:hypothetical protein NQ314_019426, partial [Rhamnusium bicolor]